MSGILFSKPMVLALLEGRKTQTRRVFPNSEHLISAKTFGLNGWRFTHDRVPKKPAKPPQNKIGDKLWVREAWRADSQLDNVSPAEMSRGEPIFYEADQRVRTYGCHMMRAGRKRASMHIPRWASRITLEVTDVRIERLQDISNTDAIMEGVEQSMPDVDPLLWRDYQRGGDCDSAKLSYETLWDSINGSGAWKANPWVVAYTFRVHLMNIDQLGGTQ